MKILALVTTLAFMGLSAGLECSPFARPWLVHLSSGQTGVLLNEWWVLTKFDYYGASGVMAQLGVDDLSSPTGGEQELHVAQWINHDPYAGRRRKRSPMHDLALVQLAKPARLTAHVQPIPPPSRCPEPGELCVMAGWGSGSSKQQCVVQEILDGDTCSRLNEMHYVPWMSCGRPKGECLEDDSSVLVCGGELHGVGGFQFFSEGGCSMGRPDTFSSICHYTSWIKEVMENTPTIDTTPFPTMLPTTTTDWPIDFVS